MYEALVIPAAFRSHTVVTHTPLTDQKYRQKMLMKVLSLRFLVCQGLAIRGHREEDSNLVQLLKCRSEIHSWIKDGRYLSHDIVNEFPEMMAHQLLRGILKEIKNATWFALVADKTQDVSGLGQFTISLWWVDKCYAIYEDVIGLIKQMLLLQLVLSRMFLHAVAIS